MNVTNYEMWQRLDELVAAGKGDEAFELGTIFKEGENRPGERLAAIAPAEATTGQPAAVVETPAAGLSIPPRETEVFDPMRAYPRGRW